jgi:hypothetical protein
MWERTLASFGNFSWDIHSPSKTKSKYQSWYLTLCCGLEVQNPTQALKSVKGPGNTFDISPKWERTLSSFDNFSWDIYRVPSQKNSKYQSWYLTPCCGLEVQNPTQVLKSVKVPGYIFDLSPKWERTLTIFHGIFIRSPQKNSKYQSWYLTLCCGLQMQNTTQALKSVKGPGSAFDLNPKWERTLPSFGNFSWDIYRVPPQFFFQISKLIFDTLLWACGTESHPGT